ncbi:uncharacterized protein LOC125943367 [Dermacentor silvarum]|uniref:uncharacterized protein LOC125943367 n=1 Tax=Dermacentor silvarum TaxID=543639 RepID=UPI002101D193|nr:uncharacterized protein LOC125943367 [Dermacentor silvarum]
MPPQAAIYIAMVSSPPVADGDYVLSPVTDVLLAKNVAMPNTLVTVTGNRIAIPILNFSASPQLIPAGMSLAAITAAEDCEICALDPTRSSSSSFLCTTTSSPRDVFVRMIPDDLPSDQATDLRRLLESYHDIFDFDDRSLSQTSVVQHRIDTGNASPIRRRPYRVSLAERRVIQGEVDKMLTKGVIEPSSSPWASPVVLVKKKDGSWRFCVDYRHLNNITRKDVYPLPRIDDALDCLHGATYFSSIDLRSGYWQITVDAMDREKTAFVTPDGLYQFKVMPFGLCNAPATFERMMDSLLRGYKWSTCLCYLDDVIVFSPTFEDHLARLSAILDVFRRAGLQLNSSKCRFARRHITVLGHLVSASGVQPDPDKVRAVRDFPVPRSVSDVRSFVGLCSYFRRFVRNFADIARPLTDLLKKDISFSWGRAQIQIYDDILEDFIDMEPEAIVPHKGKVKLAKKLVPQPDDHARPAVQDADAAASTRTESWVLGLRAKFKNMRKKVEHPSEEMQTVKRKAHHTGTKVPPSNTPNKKLCRLFDCSHLVVHGETVDSISLHNEWLHKNPHCRDEEMLRPRLLATAQDRHERLKSMTLAEALLLYPFLATEVSLLVEFETLFKRAAADCIQDGCSKMGTVILDRGSSDEVATFSEVATEEPVLAALEFVAARCKEQLDTIFTTEAPQLTPSLVRSYGGLDLFVDGQRLFTFKTRTRFRHTRRSRKGV